MNSRCSSDEPLSNLDAKLRVQTRAQIASLQRRLGTTTVYVTHDQVEALTMGTGFIGESWHRLSIGGDTARSWRRVISLSSDTTWVFAVGGWECSAW